MSQTKSNIFQNKVAIVTGGGSGLGEAVVLDLLEAGAKVVSVDLKKNDISNYENKLNRSIDNNLYVSRTDVSDRNQVKDLYKNTLVKYERIDFLLNFAGINIDKPFLDLLDEDWEKVINIHLKGTFICSQEFAKNKTEGTGHIITVGAACGIQGRKNGANFCSAKGGIFSLTKCMALELAPKIQVNCILPSAVDTPEVRERYNLDTDDGMKKVLNGLPIGRIGDVSDVTRMVRCIIGSKYTTGATFLVNGGEYMQ